MKKNKYLHQFVFSKAAHDGLNVLMQRMNTKSQVEVVKHALQLLDYATMAKTNGSKIILRDSEGNEKELSISFDSKNVN